MRPVWPNTFQRPCARSIAVAGLGHSIGSPTTTLPSATSNGNATKYVIPAVAHLLNRTSPYGRAARLQTFHVRSLPALLTHSHRSRVFALFFWRGVAVWLLARRYIDNRFSELVGVPRAFGGHDRTMIENTSL